MWLTLLLLAADCTNVNVPSSGWFGLVVPAPLVVKDALAVVHADEPLVIEESANQNATLRSYNGGDRREYYTLSFHNASVRRVRLTFAKPLDNMEVDAVGITASSSRLRLLDEKRIRDRVVEIESQVASLQSLEVTLHHGVRKRPILDAFTLAYVGTLGAIPLLDPSFSEPGYSYFYVAQAQVVRLCEGKRTGATLPASLVEGKRAKLLVR